MSARTGMLAAECGPSGCGPPPAADPISTEQRSSQRKSMAIAICTMLLAVPALIGSCCWPIFVGVLIGMLSGNSFQGAAKKASSHGGVISFFHGFQVAIMMTVMASIVQYAYWTVLTKRHGVQGQWAKFGPVWILVVAGILVNVQPIMILCIGSWSEGLNCDDPKIAPTWPCTNAFWTADATNTFFPNRWQGWAIQICCTYVGYALLIVGVFQATEMMTKLSTTWRRARGQA